MQNFGTLRVDYKLSCGKAKLCIPVRKHREGDRSQIDLIIKDSIFRVIYYPFLFTKIGTVVGSSGSGLSFVGLNDVRLNGNTIIFLSNR